MTQYKKIKVNKDVLRYNGIDCQEKCCPFKFSCANHETAGEFRSEDGITPKLSILNGQIGCSTIYYEIDDTINYETVPVEHTNYGSLVIIDGNIELAKYEF